MAKKSKLLSALDVHKGFDYRLQKQKRLQKQAVKRKSPNALKPLADSLPVAVRHEESLQPSTQLDLDDRAGWESDDESTISSTTNNTLTAQKPSTINIIETIHKTTSEAEDDGPSVKKPNAPISHMSNGNTTFEIVQEGSLDEERGLLDEAIPLSELEELSDEEKEDVIPHQRLTINNIPAINKAYKSIALPLSELGFSEHQTIISAAPFSLLDVNDDLNRELAFYDQCLQAAKQGRALLKKAGVPFSRPNDYFAEMVKSDEHMSKIRQKMVDEAANKKAAADARKQRDLKKFGKQVQVAKLQERDKVKRETLEKIKMLKRKRNQADPRTTQEEDMFDVALEDASKLSKGSRLSKGPSDGQRSSKRQKKDSKFGFGGRKRFAKSGDAISSSDLRGFSSKKMKGQNKGSQRLGKSRRAKQR